MEPTRSKANHGTKRKASVGQDEQINIYGDAAKFEDDDGQYFDVDSDGGNGTPAAASAGQLDSQGAPGSGRDADVRVKKRLARKAELARESRRRRKMYVQNLESKVSLLQRQVQELQSRLLAAGVGTHTGASDTDATGTALAALTSGPNAQWIARDQSNRVDKEDSTPEADDGLDAVWPFKAVYVADVRRFTLPSCSFSRLLRMLRDIYKLPPLLAIKYEDDEGDLVAITSESELREAFRQLRSNTKGATTEDALAMDASTSASGPKPLKVYIEGPNPHASAASATAGANSIRRHSYDRDVDLRVELDTNQEHKQGRVEKSLRLTTRPYGASPRRQRSGSVGDIDQTLDGGLFSLADAAASPHARSKTLSPFAADSSTANRTHMGAVSPTHDADSSSQNGIFNGTHARPGQSNVAEQEESHEPSGAVDPSSVSPAANGTGDPPSRSRRKSSTRGQSASRGRSEEPNDTDLAAAALVMSASLR